MTFRTAATWSAAGAAILSFGYAVAVAVPSLAGGAASSLASASTGRAFNIGASWILFAFGLVLTLAMAGLAERDGTPSGSASWGLGVGLVGAALTAAHGLYDALSVPILVTQWNMGLAGRQAAISAFAGLPSQVDPKGLASLLFVGLFVVSCAARRSGGGPIRTVGYLHGGISAAAFAAGALLAGTVPLAFPLLAGLSFGVTGPTWWALVARDLRAQ